VPSPAASTSRTMPRCARLESASLKIAVDTGHATPHPVGNRRFERRQSAFSPR
jgi:hypothetical protein